MPPGAFRANSFKVISHQEICWISVTPLPSSARVKSIERLTGKKFILLAAAGTKILRIVPTVERIILVYTV